MDPVHRSRIIRVALGLVVIFAAAAVAALRPSLLVTGGVGLAAVTGLVLSAWLVRRYPQAMLACVAAVIVFTPRTGAVPIVNVAGVAVLPIDLLIAVSVLSAAAGIKTLSRTLRRSGWLFALFLLLFAMQLASGFAQFGAAAALEARNIFAFVSIIAFLASVDEPVGPIVRRWLYITAAALIPVAIFNGAITGIGSANVIADLGGGGTATSRVISSDQAFAVAAAAVLAVRDFIEGKGARYGIAALTLLAFVAIAQHRSVWVATAASLLALALLQRNWGRVVVALGGATAVACVVLPIVAVVSPATLSVLAGSLSTISLSSGTGGVRAVGSEALVRQLFSEHIDYWLFGYPYGTGWLRIIFGEVVTFSPHNAYIEVLLRTGILGATLFLLCFVVVAAFRSRHSAGAIALLALTSVYWLSYSVPLTAALIVGAALCARNGGRGDEAVDRFDLMGKSTRLGRVPSMSLHVSTSNASSTRRNDIPRV